jgi:S1-C subfamily serine protease
MDTSTRSNKGPLETVRSISPALYLACALVVLTTSCRILHEHTEETQKRAFEPFIGHKIGDELLWPYLQNRTRVVVNRDEEGAYIGLAAIISEDNYLLSAAHLVQDGNLKLGSLHDFIEKRSMKDLSDVRVVRIFEELDLAILKQTSHFDPLQPHFFHNLRPHVEQGSRIFSTGNLLATKASSGVVVTVSTNRLSLDGNVKEDFYSHTLTAPLRHGDSGGPIVNLEGDLVGIVSEARVGIFAEPMKPRSYAGMIPNDLLWAIINQDRADQDNLLKDSTAKGTSLQSSTSASTPYH